MLDVDLIAPEKLRPLKRSEYEWLVEHGAFEGERVELLYGQLVTMSRQSPPHADIVSRILTMLLPPLLDRAEVRRHSPVALAEDSEPEPDVSVAPPGDYSRAHPSQLLLAIEVSESSLRKDRAVKALLYASSGVPEYWIVDIDGRAVEVHRDPEGGRYARVTRHGAGDLLHPLAFPDIAVSVSEILPEG